MLGSEMLIAPIINKCLTPPFCSYAKSVYLPEGEWTHLWTQQNYSGPIDSTVSAPIGQPAVFYHTGSATGEHFVANLLTHGIQIPN